MSADQYQRAIAYISKIANPLGLIDDHFINATAAVNRLRRAAQIAKAIQDNDGAEIERLLNG